MKEAKYIIDNLEIINRYKKYAEYFDVFYPIKTNDDPLVLKLLCQCGSGFEVESLSHLLGVLKLGATVNKILYYSAYSQTDLLTAIKLGVTFFVVDSINDLMLLDKHLKNYRFLIRYQVNSSVCKSPKRLGATSAEIKEMLAGNYHGIFEGFSFYISAEYNNFVNKCKVIDEICELQIDFKMLNVGGGLPLTECKSIFDYSYHKNIQALAVEPGRYLLDDCIDLEVQILKKRMVDNKCLLFVNMSIYNGLLDCVVKNKQFPITVLNEKRKGHNIEYCIVGPTGDISDILGHYLLPDTLQVGDKLIISNCGAYSRVLCTNFYRFPHSKSKYKKYEKN